jgi:dGTPase
VTVHILSFAVYSAFRSAVRVVSEPQQRGHVVIGDEPHMTTASTVATVGAPVHHRTLSAETHAARATITTTYVQLAFIDKGAHRDASRYLPHPLRILNGMNDEPLAPVSAHPVDDGAAERAQRWAATMAGHDHVGVRLAHADSWAGSGDAIKRDRRWREEREHQWLAPLATRASGAGRRHLSEEPDPYRTCFERDRDRILHDTAFRRLAGKTQVFVFPDDHQRTRLTHALEVAQVATSVARALGLNVALTEAIALGHDCGHGPGGHASEDALSPYVEGGYDHALWGADVTLARLNLCHETLDGIRNHSWSRPAPGTPEGEVVSWADRIAYVCHDFEDAVATGIVTTSMLPSVVTATCGTSRRQQLAAFVASMIDAAAQFGRIGMTATGAEALAAFRRFNYDHVYLRPASQAQARAVIDLLRALVEHYADRPNLLPDHRPEGMDAGSAPALAAAVAYVSGMTDRFACRQAVAQLGWSADRLPAGIDL